MIIYSPLDGDALTSSINSNPDHWFLMMRAAATIRQSAPTSRRSIAAGLGRTKDGSRPISAIRLSTPSSLKQDRSVYRSKVRYLVCECLPDRPLLAEAV
jgi:hypothetical protein